MFCYLFRRQIEALHLLLVLQLVDWNGQLLIEHSLRHLRPAKDKQIFHGPVEGATERRPGRVPIRLRFEELQVRGVNIQVLGNSCHHLRIKL